MNISPLWYWCKNGREPDWPGASATHSRLSSLHLRLAFLRTIRGIRRRLLEREKVTLWDVWIHNFILQRLRCCLWSLMLFAEVSSHRLEILCTSVWIHYCCWTACLTNCFFWRLWATPMKNLSVWWSTARLWFPYWFWLHSELWHMVSLIRHSAGCFGVMFLRVPHKNERKLI